MTSTFLMTRKDTFLSYSSKSTSSSIFQSIITCQKKPVIEINDDVTIAFLIGENLMNVSRHN